MCVTEISLLFVSSPSLRLNAFLTLNRRKKFEILCKLIGFYWYNWKNAWKIGNTNNVAKEKPFSNGSIGKMTLNRFNPVVLTSNHEIRDNKSIISKSMKIFYFFLTFSSNLGSSKFLAFGSLIFVFHFSESRGSYIQ
jgi:hypothetical protein